MQQVSVNLELEQREAFFTVSAKKARKMRSREVNSKKNDPRKVNCE